MKIPFWLNKIDRFRIGIITNPNAGMSRREKNQKELDALGKIVDELNRDVESELDYSDFITTRNTKNVAELTDTLLEFINEKKVVLIFVFGGDGTLQKVIDVLISEFFEKKSIARIPPIASLGGGTMLAVHGWLGWKREPIKIFQKIIEKDIEHLPRKRIRPLAIVFKNPKNKELEVRFGFIFVIGAMTRIMKLYDEGGRSVSSGLTHIMLSLAAGVTGWPKEHRRLSKKFIADVAIDAKPLAFNELLVLVCSVTDSLLFGVAPFSGRAASNQFYSAATSFSVGEIAMWLPLIARATVVPPVGFFNQPAAEVIVRPDTENLIFIDGEFYEVEKNTSISIKLGPPVEMVSAF
jgi:diacylglycerol kinase family enzyme